MRKGRNCQRWSDPWCDSSKDGKTGGQEITVTIQLIAIFEVEGRSVRAPAFIQPGSEQMCPLGMNVIPLFGISLATANGESLFTLKRPKSRK